MRARANLISQNEAFGFLLSAIAMLDVGKCRCLQLLAHRSTAFEGVAARSWQFFCERFGNWEEDRILKILMRDGGSVMVRNFDCNHINS